MWQQVVAGGDAGEAVLTGTLKSRRNGAHTPLGNFKQVWPYSGLATIVCVCVRARARAYVCVLPVMILMVSGASMG